MLKMLHPRNLGLPILLFSWALLLIWSASKPEKLYFDEVHYVPAARVLLLNKENINPEHPPFGKFLIGLSAKILGPVVSEPVSFRLPSVLSGLLALAALYGILCAIGFSQQTALIATFLSSLNFLWFVQSKIATLDMISTSLGLTAVYLALKKHHAIAITVLALACNSKWTALAYFPLVWLSFRRNLPTAKVFLKITVAFVFVLFISALFSLLFFKNGLDDLSWQFGLHKVDIRISNREHPYSSSFWSWPLLLRPIWYLYKEAHGVSNGIWAGGNPVLWTTGLLGFLLACFRCRNLFLICAYGTPLLFWATASFLKLTQGPQFFYYFLPSSLWLGPLTVSFVQSVVRKASSRAALLALLMALSLGLFLFFFPLLSGTPISMTRLQRCIWLRSWI